MNRFNVTAPKILVALLLCAVLGASFANPGWGRGKGNESEQDAEHPRDQRRQAKKMQREEMRAQRAAGLNRQQPQQSPAPADKPKRQAYTYDASPANSNNGKMTPEDRRALRRQINEANQTISQRNYP